ncbi:MAG: hypothetical protein JNK77_00180 [Saprospiraceae bacterium]|jgi:hypothetical protein|nr:hypothetical protein [Saprospiraceae bacterium]
MDATKRTAPLSNLQLELLKLYAAGVPDQYLDDLKILIARFLFAKARAKADQVWDEKKYTDEILNELLQRNGE